MTTGPRRARLHFCANGVPFGPVDTVAGLVRAREAVTTPNDESARILAAAGWQSDPRRLPVLRDLLREHLKRIYLYSYEESCNRAAAMDRTRRTILRVARTMQSIPAGCPLVTWIFLALEEARVSPAENPDFWRLLVIAEEERGTANRRAAANGQVRADGRTASRTTADDESADSPPISRPGHPAATAAADSTQGVDPASGRLSIDEGVPAQSTAGDAIGATTATGSHPMLRPLVTLYQRFLDMPSSEEEFERRAGWPAAASDLDCFLRAQFADAGDASCRPATAWRRWVATRPWRRPRTLSALVAAVVVLAISLVVGFTLAPPKGRRATVAGSARPPARDTTTVPPASAPPAVANRSGDTIRGPVPRRASGLPDSGSRASRRAADCPVAAAQATLGLVSHGQATARINGARCELVNRDSLRFAWMPAQSVTEYRLCLITAKRDTLGIVPAISGTCVTVPVSGVPGMGVPGSFIFRLDGLAAGQLIAVSDPQPFEIP